MAVAVDPPAQRYASLMPTRADAPVLFLEPTRAIWHDRSAFTQGLAVLPAAAQAASLLESTGLWGSSTLRVLDTRNGAATRVVRLPARVFGEGVAVTADGVVVQLTYRSQQLLRFNATTLAFLSSAPYPPGAPAEGWGIAALPDGTLAVSDGSSVLQRWTRDAARVLDWVRVTDGGRDVTGLNDLTVADGGVVMANVYGTHCVAILDAGTGRVKTWLYAPASLYASNPDPGANVMNGLAWHRGSLWLTGKRWPAVFQTHIVARLSAAWAEADPTLSQRPSERCVAAADAQSGGELSVAAKAARDWAAAHAEALGQEGEAPGG